MTYRPNETATVLVDHEAAANLLTVCSAPDAKIALVGFNEYAKHLLNWVPEKIVAIYDEEPWKVGIKFRGKEVSPPHLKHNINNIVICD